MKDDESRNSLNTTTEVKLIKIWSEALGIENADLQETFLNLGGESITATQCLNRIREEFSVDIPIEVFFDDAGTISGIAQLVDELRLTRQPASKARAGA